MSLPVIEGMPAAFDDLVVRGLIAVLEADGVVEFLPVYPSGFGSGGEVAATLGTRPADPDRLASFTPYAVSGGGPDAMERLGVQVWLRYHGTNPRAVRSLAGSIRDSLDGLGPLTLSTGVSMSQCLRSSGSSLGEDSRGRGTWVENFYADVNHPTPNRY